MEKHTPGQIQARWGWTCYINQRMLTRDIACILSPRISMAGSLVVGRSLTTPSISYQFTMKPFFGVLGKGINLIVPLPLELHKLHKLVSLFNNHALCNTLKDIRNMI